jgi:UDP-N-acetylmuramoyl-tripeptide--D-alanyl-D-alanine ligase
MTPIPENQANFSADEIVRATGAHEVARAARNVCGVSADSRTIERGNLFVALRGERHDAHEHVPQAILAGAGAVLVERDVEAPDGVGVYRVGDTLRALGALAGFHRRRFDIPVVAITGSVGKTTTKDLVASAFAGLKRNAIATRGNLNNRIGAPMTLFTLGPEHEGAVVELGMNMPGEIAELTSIVTPRVGVVTAVAEAHTEGVGGIEGVAREKGALLEGLARECVAVWCSDEPRLAPYGEGSPAERKITYGTNERADVRLLRWELDGARGTKAVYSIAGREIDVALAMLGGAAALDAAGALAVALAIDPEKLEAAASALANARPSPHRMTVVEIENEALAIDDTYNASPRSIAAAIETASALAKARGGRTILVLGDMLELGRDAERLHEEIGREAARAAVKGLIVCGELMSSAGRAALTESMKSRGEKMKIVIMRDPEGAAECVREMIAPRDVVLVKGSRGMRMERVIAALEGQR